MSFIFLAKVLSTYLRNCFLSFGAPHTTSYADRSRPNWHGSTRSNLVESTCSDGRLHLRSEDTTAGASSMVDCWLVFGGPSHHQLFAQRTEPLPKLCLTLIGVTNNLFPFDTFIDFELPSHGDLIMIYCCGVQQ